MLIIRRVRWDLMWRLVDQAAWSFAIFLVTYGAGTAMSIGDFARFSVATAIGFIAVAPQRSLAVISRIVVGAKNSLSPWDAVDSAHGARVSLAVAILCGGAALAAWRQVVPLGMLVAFAVSVMCLADTPRQILIACREYRNSAFLALTYLGLTAGVVGLARVLHASSEILIAGWASCMLLVALNGWLKVRRHRRRGFDWPSWRRFAPRMAVESLYLATASQFAMLFTYLVHLERLTAGLRLSYSLVFAPLFMFVQGLEPVLLQRLARLRKEGCPGARRLVALWCGCFTALFIGAGGCAMMVFGRSHSSVFQSAEATVPAVGAMILGAQCLVAVGHFRRLFGDPVLMHRITLSLTVLEFVAIVVGFAIGGGPGILWAVALAATVKVCTTMFFLFRRVGLDATPTFSPASKERLAS